MILITPNRGLCGGLPTNLNRRASALTLDLGVPSSLVAIGRKGRDFFRRTNIEIQAEFTELGDYPEYLDILPIARVVMDSYLAGEVDQVFLVYAYFVNTVTQEHTTFAKEFADRVRVIACLSDLPNIAHSDAASVPC